MAIQTQAVSECTLISLVWEVESYDVRGRIVWRTGDTHRSVRISVSDLAGVAATGVIRILDTAGYEIRSRLIPADHDKIVKVVDMLHRMFFENQEIGVRSFRMMWVFT